MNPVSDVIAGFNRTLSSAPRAEGRGTRKKIVVTVTLSVRDDIDAATARREVLTLINERCNWQFGIRRDDLRARAVS